MTKRAALFMLSLLVAGAVRAEPIRIAAVVNDEVITSADINDRRDFILATSETPATPEAQRALYPRILDALITETLELQEAKRLSIEVTDAEIAEAVAKVEQLRKRPTGSLYGFIETNNLSKRTMEQQLRAQVAWGKVVQRKIRRSVNIAQDEVARAQVAQASAPGVPEVRIAAISLPILKPEDEKNVAALAEEIAGSLNNGSDFMTVAGQLAGTGKAAMNAPIWVSEETLQPAMQQALRTLQPGQVTQPLRSQNSYQLISLLDRRMAKPTPDNTEVVVKQFTVPLPAKKTNQNMDEARATVRSLRAAPGSCTDAELGALNGKVKVEFIRATYQQMTRDLRGVVEHLGVTEISEPLLSDTSIILVMPCERIEPSIGLPDATKVRTELYNEKLELEAQKYMRNLRRDAFIDVKGV